MVDTDGNEMTFGYQKADGQILLDRVAYTGPSPTHHVQFYYEVRLPRDRETLYAPGPNPPFQPTGFACG